MVVPAAREEGLSVIALVSGGKDSFFSILHCLANGHRVVALANLHPGVPQPPRETSVAGASSPRAGAALVPVDEGAAVTVLLPGEKPPQAQAQAQSHGHGHGHGQSPSGLANLGPEARTDSAPDHEEHEEEEDLNSFMYQTVGHQVIPLYAEATGIPLYRRAIVGGAGQHGKDYSHYSTTTKPGSSSSSSSTEGDADETESMIPLLRAIKAEHPEANAICAGAILSTYQRTRVESVATRLGLVPLAYLWKFPTLPVPVSSAGGSDAQLLDDMAAVGLEARIIKVASGGLDDSFLWTNVASAAGKEKVARAMRRFGTAEKGAVIGEGGEFETLVLDGPPELFKKRIVIEEQDRRVVHEGGGTAWLSFRGGAHVESKEAEGSLGHATTTTSVDHVRIPDLLDDRFVSVVDVLSDISKDENASDSLTVEDHSVLSSNAEEQLLQENLPSLGALQRSPKANILQQWFFTGGGNTKVSSGSITEEATSLINQIRQRVKQHGLTPSSIINSTIVLRRMADFPTINAIYGSLFDAPNPPSRVTISCGASLLPSEASISISLTVHTQLQPGQRQGLHVQSRSYWAPANIGPYSQAVSFPLASLGSASSSSGDGPRLVSIAGQIPLVPATMALPPSSSDSLGYQLALSLQHLWRIGLDVNVRWWTSAVAYFPRQESASLLSMRLRARLAAKAWEAAHLWSGKKRSNGDERFEDSDEDTEDEGGPDLWDRRFNTQYMSFAAAGDGEKAKGQKLPDWAVLDDDESRVLATGGENQTISKKARRTAMLPPLFAAEVEELPRGAGVEWHAHLGIAGGDADDVVVLKGEKRGGFSVSQTIVRDSLGGGASIVQTVVMEKMLDDQVDQLSLGLDNSLSLSTATKPFSSLKEQDQLVKDAVARLGRAGTLSASSSEANHGRDESSPVVVVRYLDVGVYSGAQDEMASSIPIVPCRSLWNGSTKGERLASVTIYQSVFER